MKIYPSKHIIMPETAIKPKDISLSCVVTDAVEKEYRLSNILHKAQSLTLRSVMPYEEFDRPDPYLFTKEKVRVETATKMIRTDTGYAFFPPDAIEFYPALFDFYALLKRNLTYTPGTRHNIRVGIIESAEQKLAQSFVSLFGDPDKRPFAPPLFTVNHGDIKKESYTNGAIEDFDFVVIESMDGKSQKADGQAIDFDMYMEQHTNVWVVIENYAGISAGESLTPTADGPFDITHALPGSSFTEQKVSMKKDKLLHDTAIPDYFKEGYEVLNVFTGGATPVIVLEKPGKGFVLLSRKEFFDQIQDYRVALFETLMQVYGRSYMTTAWQTGWITDSPVDYLPRQEKVFGKHHEIYKVENMIDAFLYKDNSMVSIVDVIIKQDTIKLKAVTPDKEILFEKKSDKKDPVKERDHRSYFTTRQSIIYYKEESVNRIEMPLTITHARTGRGDFLYVKDYKSTSLRIDTMGDVQLRIPDTGNVDYFLCVKDNIMSLLAERLYEEEKHGIHLATVSSSYRSVIKNYDTRTFGGGLSEREEPNYNLLDIGHLEGRPYRTGGTMVIKLPLAYKDHDDLIKKTIDRYIAAGDFYVVVYE